MIHWQTSFPVGAHPPTSYVFCAQTWPRMQSTRALHCQWSLQLLLDIVLDQSAEHEVWISNRWSTMTYYVFTMFTNIYIIQYLIYIYSKLHILYLYHNSEIRCSQKHNTFVRGEKTLPFGLSLWRLVCRQTSYTCYSHINLECFTLIFVHMYVLCMNIQIE